MWIRLCASWGPEGKTGMTLLPVLGNNCCLDKEGQGCLLILTVSSEWACWLLQRILWKSHCSSISGNVRTNLCNGLSCPVLPGGALAWDAPGPGETFSSMTRIDPGEECQYEKLYFYTSNCCVNKSGSEESPIFRYLAQIFSVIQQSTDEHERSH